jgi:peptidoglycan-N-acetylglucosamine deacetylase
MYTHRTPFFFRLFFPACEWSGNTDKNEIYLTFDDGPIPDVTEFALEILEKYDCKATFFCVGENIYRNPEVFKKILDNGHQAGNHTYHHLNGWHTYDEEYFENVKMCKEIMEETCSGKYNLFRPPYGKIKRSQINKLKQEYRIIMWNLLTGDFDPVLSSEKCLNAAKKYSKNGSFVIFHDSLKAESKLKTVLPDYIDYALNQGYTFKKIL